MNTDDNILTKDVNLDSKQTAKHSKKCKCKNCGYVFEGNYCPICGQSVKIQRLRFKSIFQDIFSGLTNISGGFTYTIVKLFSDPGTMIINFIRGKRVKYFRPFQMLFVLAAIYALLSQFSYDALNEGEKSTRKINFNDTTVNINNSSIATTEIKLDSNDIYEVHFIHGYRKMQESIRNNKIISKFIDVVRDAYSSNKALKAIVLLPFNTIGTVLAFRKRKKLKHYNNIEILFAQCYISCQQLIVSILFVPFSGVSAIIDTVGSVILTNWTWHGFFGYKWEQTFLRYILYLLYVGLIMTILIIIFLVCYINLIFLFK